MPGRATPIGKFALAALSATIASGAIGAQVAAQDSRPTPVASPAPAAGGDDATTKRIAHGREIFANYSCGSCHALADGGGEGHVGPSLDANPNLTEALVTDRVNNGSGPMPAFGGQLSKEEVADLAFYITHVAKKA